MRNLVIALTLLFGTLSAECPGISIEESNDEALRTYLMTIAPLNTQTLKAAFELEGIHCPAVVLAQARLESGNFSSILCKEHNNLFGMKLPAVRQTSAVKGTDNGYAIYDTWYESVIDMALFQEWYRNRGRDMDDYFGFLRAIGYAEDQAYIHKLRILMEGKI